MADLFIKQKGNKMAKRVMNKIRYDYLNEDGSLTYDDRPVSAGIMLSDADLLGVPLRVIVSPRNLKQNIVEVKSRDKSFSASI